MKAITKLLLILSLALIPTTVAFSQGGVTRPGTQTTKPTTKPARTSSTKGKINGHEYVDLGLPSGTKWATCNVGADNPWDYGNYYAWGETNTKRTYTKNNCVTYGKKLDDFCLYPVYDVANNNWGGSWKMPNNWEMKELIDKCKWNWTKLERSNGYKVIGPNGNSIFLPAVGYFLNEEHLDDGTSGRYWISTPDEEDSTLAYLLFFDENKRCTIWGNREYGRYIRPVIN